MLWPIIGAKYWPITDCLFQDASSFNKSHIVTIVKSQWYVSNWIEFTERYLKLNSIHSFTRSSLLCSVEC